MLNPKPLHTFNVSHEITFVQQLSAVILTSYPQFRNAYHSPEKDGGRRRRGKKKKVSDTD
jgi:hypothetical protein